MYITRRYQQTNKVITYNSASTECQTNHSITHPGVHKRGLVCSDVMFVANVCDIGPTICF